MQKMLYIGAVEEFYDPIFGFFFEHDIFLTLRDIDLSTQKVRNIKESVMKRILNHLVETGLYNGKNGILEISWNMQDDYDFIRLYLDGRFIAVKTLEALEYLYEHYFVRNESSRINNFTDFLIYYLRRGGFRIRYRVSSNNNFRLDKKIFDRITASALMNLIYT